MARAAQPTAALRAPAGQSAADVPPAWRRDPKSWLAEIQRLRDAGDTARADAEYAEFKRQQRAYAGSARSLKPSRSAVAAGSSC